MFILFFYSESQSPVVCSQEYWLLLGSLYIWIESSVCYLAIWWALQVAELNLPLSTSSISEAWCSFLESSAKCTPLGPALLVGGPEDRFQSLFLSPGRQLPIAGVSDLVALFCTHLADASFLPPANPSGFWFLLKEILSSRCCPFSACGCASPRGPPAAGLSWWPSTRNVSVW